MGISFLAAADRTSHRCAVIRNESTQEYWQRFGRVPSKALKSWVKA